MKWYGTYRRVREGGRKGLGKVKEREGAKGTRTKGETDERERDVIW